MSIKKYLKEIENLKTDNLQGQIWSLNKNDTSFEEKLNDICKGLTLRSENLKRILGDIILETALGKIKEDEYSMLRHLMQDNIESTMIDIRKAAEIAYDAEYTSIYNFLIELLVNLHMSMLKYSPTYEKTDDALRELYQSDTLDSIKEKLSAAISKWNDAETTYRGAHAMLPNYSILSPYFKYNKRRIDDGHDRLEESLEISHSYLKLSPYVNTTRESFVSASLDSKTGFFSSLETKTEEAFVHELHKLRELLSTNPQNISAHRMSKATIKVRIDEALKIIENLSHPDSELKSLYDDAYNLFKKSFALESDVAQAGEEAREYVSCIFANKDTMRRVKIQRELSHSPKSIEETFSVTLFQMKIYATVNFLLGFATIGADLKVLNILEQTGHFGNDKWGIVFAILSSIIASIIGYKALKTLSNTFQLIPEIFRLQSEYGNIERRL